VPVPPPTELPPGLWKRLRPRPKRLQKRILQYLNEGRKASINAVSEDLGVHRFSARRCLKKMEGKGQVTDQPELFAPSVVPGILAHGFSITDEGRRELEFQQSIKETIDPYPLGYRILLFMSHGGLMTIGQIAKMTDKQPGHVRRIMKSLQNKGLVDHLVSGTRTAFGWDTITNLYRITDVGSQMLGAGPEAYLQIIKSRGKLPRVDLWNLP